MTRRRWTDAVSDAALIAAYRRTGSVQKAAAAVGLYTARVHKRLAALGVTRAVRVFTDAERAVLKRDYLAYRAAGKLADLGQQLGRTVPFLSRQARILGLTSYSHERSYLRVWKGLPEETARRWFEAFQDCRLTLTQFCAKHHIDDKGFSGLMRSHFAAEWEALIELKAPRQSKYRYGRAFEYRVRDRMRALGFFVLRSPASRSPIDILAIRTGLTLFIQCKRNGQLGVSEWNTLYALATSVGAVPLLAATRAGSGIELFRLLRPKDGTRRAQPCEPYTIPAAVR